MTSSAELRKQFLDFFQAKGHEIVASSSLVPGNDPTLLFTNAGMVPFKDVFLGFETRAYRRAASSQRCVRAGGKHNDLENVGYTARHHTFFEMLGNFSFGDYFKAEAIAYAWAFLTEVLKLPAERLWVTVYDEDDEAADIWLKQIKIDPARLSRIGAKDNFWSMGDTGPCGPCSEIFYDHGPEVAGGPPGTPEEDGDRYVEIWNLVFMQYDRNKDGELKPLPAPSVDTGMGLERLAAVMQGVHSNYAIDLFQHLIKATAELAGVADLNNPSLKVIADHIRSCAFLIVDGITPSNEKRGYVLRRIIRRAARHGHQLGLTQPFFHQLVAPLVQEMGEAYPELAKAQAHVEKVLRREEEQFAKTLERGLKILEGEIASMSGTTLSGDIIFELYATYGFPIDLTNDIARERALSLDMDGYAQRMKAHQETGGAGDEFGADYSQRVVLDGATVFTGYEALSGQGQVTALLKEGEQVERLKTGEEGVVVLDRTPFYAESGGQVGDTGSLSADGMAFSVLNTQKQGSLHLHVGRVDSGHIALGDTLQAQVQDLRRHATILNHSATHLMHAALRQVLGEHVQQKGSLVDPDRLRFDFSHFEPMSAEQITQVEHIVNAQIRANQDAHVQIMSMQGALESGAMALFGEKYGDEVRVVTIGFSTELCGGTHVKRAGDIGLFKIINESGTASGIRRIEAVTGENALRWVEDNAQRLEQIAQLVKSNRNDAHEKVRQMLDKTRQLEKELETLKSRLATQAGADLVSQALDIKGLKVLAVNLPDADPKSLLDTLDQLKNKLGKAVVLLATVSDGKITLVAGVTKQETALIKAGDLVKSVAEQVGGKGGGRPDMARGGGVNPQALDAALQSVPVWVSEQLA